MTDVIGPFVEFIYCYCGCRKTKPKYDKHGRETKRIKGHNCRGKKHSEETKRKIGKAQLGEKNHNYKGGIRRKHRYLFGLAPIDHPYKEKDGIIPLHRLIYEAYITKKWGIKFYLHPSIELHHNDKNPENNEIVNLKPVTELDHRRLHQLKDMTDRVCFKCKRSYEQLLKLGIKTCRTWNIIKDSGWLCAACTAQFRRKNKRNIR